MKVSETIQKEAYAAPIIEVIRMENEGVIAASAESYKPISGNSYTGSGNSYNAASGSDLEDLINDILTVED